jgi:hypothetical protein
MGGCVYIEWTGEAEGEMLLIRWAAHIAWGAGTYRKRQREGYGAERRVFVSAGVDVTLARIRNA